METLKNFLHPKRKENIRFVLSDSFVDEQGNPLEWEMRQIKAKEGMEISRDCEGAPEMETTFTILRIRMIRGQILLRQIPVSPWIKQLR